MDLTLTTLWANSADDKLMIFFLFPQKTGFDISQIVSIGDNLYEMSKPVFWFKQEKYFKKLSNEFFTQSAKR